MKQAIMIEPGKIKFEEKEKPAFSDDEVLIKIHRIGICGSDVHVWHGKHPYTSYPVIQGHEYSATVEDVGKNVKNIKPGMKVTATPQQFCGKCGPCKRGDYHICETLKVEGFQAPGVAQDYFVVSKDRIVVLPDDFSFEQGAFVEPVSVAVHAVNRINGMRGRKVVVFGAGPIGNLVGQTAQAYGAEVLITDLSTFRLDIANKCGLNNTINPKTNHFMESVEALHGKAGFNLAFECVGVEATMVDAIENIQKGGEIVVVGVFADKAKIDLGLVQDRELKLIGTLMYKYEDYLEAVRLIKEGLIKVEPLFSRHFDFYSYNKAYKYIDEEREKSMKVFIDVN